MQVNIVMLTLMGHRLWCWELCKDRNLVMSEILSVTTVVKKDTSDEIAINGSENKN